MNDIFVQTVKTSMGVYHRFILKNNNIFKSIAYIPYKKLSENEYEVAPDMNGVISDVHFDVKIKSLEPYNESKKYINVFQNTSKENNIMNYDEYGFPIFDEEYENETETLKNESKTTENVKEIKKEGIKKDKNALF